MTSMIRDRQMMILRSLSIGLLALFFVPTFVMAAANDAVPEIILLTEAEAATDTGAALARAQTDFRQNLGSDDEAALVNAKEIVALCVNLWGDTDHRLAQALTNLAIVQAQTGAHAVARDNFRNAIRVHEVAENSIVSPRLINPLRGLASANIALNEMGRAIPLYERAIHISHVNSGPNNLEQIADLAALSQTHYFLTDIDRATSIQNNLYRLQQRRYSRGSDQYVDMVLDRARWYAKIGQVDDARRDYKLVQRLLIEQNGPDAIQLIDPLIEMAFAAPGQRDNSKVFNSVEQNLELIYDGQRAVVRAIGVARANGAERPDVLTNTLTRAGDWMIYAGESRKARLAYQEAWEIADATPSLHLWRDEILARPEPIVRTPIRTIYDKNFKPTANVATAMPDRGFVEVSFSVNAFGKPINVVTTNSEPPGLMESDVVRSVRRFLYRPAIRNGKTVVFDGVSYRHDYRFNQSRLSESDRIYIERVRSQRAVDGNPVNAGDSAANSDTPIDDAVPQTLPETD